ncbi:MAG TPA: HD domain-containing phosphohydrolase [Candidatus Limnocylindria bacterium]|nr:HD domain-containing phosphohydrolase [Candidatus Limnocylindria bacterium]
MGATLAGAEDRPRLHLDRLLAQALKVAAVVLLIGAAFVAVRLTGGSPTPLNHLGYAPITLAAFLFGLRGSLVAAIVVGVVMGPLPAALGLAERLETAEAWGLRGAAYVAVGTLMGLLFERIRVAKESWRSAALKVIDREREGMTALARGVAAKDGHTGDHVARVQRLTEDLALAVGFSQSQARDLGWSAMLHDVGKLHVPDHNLLKPGPLTAAEWDVIRQHSVWGEEILAGGDGFELARRVARWHHENFDGSGYPDRLRQERIPLEARLVRVTDAFDAMTHHRPYRDARSVEWALDELLRHAGRQFDPEIVSVFRELATTGLLETVGDIQREWVSRLELPSH